jgi:alpha-D-ribose 1-methylphosphonate 5-triphosphate synthase subunit PhnL
MATRILSRKELAEELWQLFTECCDAEGLTEDQRVNVLEAIGQSFFHWNSLGKQDAPVSP